MRSPGPRHGASAEPGPSHPSSSAVLAMRPFSGARRVGPASLLPSRGRRLFTSPAALRSLIESFWPGEVWAREVAASRRVHAGCVARCVAVHVSERCADPTVERMR